MGAGSLEAPLWSISSLILAAPLRAQNSAEKEEARDGHSHRRGIAAIAARRPTAVYRWRAGRGRDDGSALCRGGAQPRRTLRHAARPRTRRADDFPLADER